MLKQQLIYITLLLRSPGAEFLLASCVADTHRQARSCVFYKEEEKLRCRYYHCLLELSRSGFQHCLADDTLLYLTHIPFFRTWGVPHALSCTNQNFILRYLEKTNAEPRIQSQTSARGMCNGRSGAGTVSLHQCSVLNHLSQTLYNLSIILANEGVLK